MAVAVAAVWQQKWIVSVVVLEEEEQKDYKGYQAALQCRTEIDKCGGKF